MRPDLPLQKAFGRERCAEQSTISNTLNAFDEQTVLGLRKAVEAIHRQHSPIFSHDYFGREMLVVEVDLRAVFRPPREPRAPPKATSSGKRNRTGRQLVRASAPQYQETLVDLGEEEIAKLYDGRGAMGRWT